MLMTESWVTEICTRVHRQHTDIRYAENALRNVLDLLAPRHVRYLLTDPSVTPERVTVEHAERYAEVLKRWYALVAIDPLVRQTTIETPFL